LIYLVTVTQLRLPFPVGLRAAHIAVVTVGFTHGCGLHTLPHVTRLPPLRLVGYTVTPRYTHLATHTVTQFAHTHVGLRWVLRFCGLPHVTVAVAGCCGYVLGSPHCAMGRLFTHLRLPLGYAHGYAPPRLPHCGLPHLAHTRTRLPHLRVCTPRLRTGWVCGLPHTHTRTFCHVACTHCRLFAHGCRAALHTVAGLRTGYVVVTAHTRWFPHVHGFTHVGCPHLRLRLRDLHHG